MRTSIIIEPSSSKLIPNNFVRLGSSNYCIAILSSSSRIKLVSLQLDNTLSLNASILRRVSPLFPHENQKNSGLILVLSLYAIEYGHGKVGRPESKSILHPDLRNIPGTPVQLIGNGLISDPAVLQGLPSPTKLKHPSHQTFHKTKIPDEDSEKGFTRYYRWHLDAALYERDPPKVTTLCAKVALQTFARSLMYRVLILRLVRC